MGWKWIKLDKLLQHLDQSVSSFTTAVSEKKMDRIWQATSTSWLIRIIVYICCNWDESGLNLTSYFNILSYLYYRLQMQSRGWKWFRFYKLFEYLDLSGLSFTITVSVIKINWTWQASSITWVIRIIVHNFRVRDESGLNLISCFNILINLDYRSQMQSLSWKRIELDKVLQHLD